MALTDPKELVLSAFAMARNAGKADWDRMTTAVLKNRLLVLTGGRFRESDYNVPTLSRFLRLAGEIISIDHSTIPPIVQLSREEVAEAAKISAKTDKKERLVGSEDQRIRADLWRAVLDYSSGRAYVWDNDKLIARPELEGDDAEWRLPTISRDDLADWRASFADAWGARGGEVAQEKVAIWRDKRLRSSFLPPEARAAWGAAEREHIVQRLHAWFRDKRVSPPSDLVVSYRQRPIATSSSDGLDEEQLRSFAIRWIESLTREELLELRIPLRVMARTDNRA